MQRLLAAGFQRVRDEKSTSLQKGSETTKGAGLRKATAAYLDRSLARSGARSGRRYLSPLTRFAPQLWRARNAGWLPATLKGNTSQTQTPKVDSVANGRGQKEKQTSKQTELAFGPPQSSGAVEPPATNSNTSSPPPFANEPSKCAQVRSQRKGGWGGELKYKTCTVNWLLS